MSLYQTIFLETDYETPEEARAARDAQVAQLATDGLICRCLNLYRATDGRRVFIIEVQEPESEALKYKPTKHKPVVPRTRSQTQRTERVEYR